MVSPSLRLIVLCLIAGFALWSQTSTSTISGVIHATSGAVVPRATVTASHDYTAVVSAQTSNAAAGSGIHVNGWRDLSSNATIDGVVANESAVTTPVANVYRLTPDNVQEYKVTTSNATAEQGRNSGASVTVATRSGTNQFDGTLY